MNKLKIAIIGAGLGGLTLARVLFINGVESTVFERDATPLSRAQGGSLDLEEWHGQPALKAAGLFEEWKKIMRKEGQDWIVMDKHAKIVRKDIARDDDESRPEADRGQLRGLFLDALNNIKWDHHVKEVVKAGERYRLTFENGHTEEFDLVVGADGAWSRTRPLLSSATPVHSGLVFVELYIHNCAERFPSLSKFIGRGTLAALGNSKGFMAQRSSDKVRIYVGLSVPETWITECGIDWNDPEIVKSRLLEYFEGWDEQILDLLRNSDDEPAFPRSIVALPATHRWTHQKGITLIGDAAHVCTPFAGEGANLAMYDGSQLALAIINGIKRGGGDALDKSIESFEKKMFKRARIATEESETNMKAFMAPNAPDPKVFADMFGPTGLISTIRFIFKFFLVWVYRSFLY